MSQSVRQLIYGSSATGAFDDDHLVEILRASRRNNPAVGVTGALLFADGNFMQVLEGPREAVEGVYRRVCGDARHRNVLVLYDREVPERTFGEWSMGFVQPGDLGHDDREAVRSLRELTEPGTGPARRLLASFRSMMPGERAVARV